MKKTLLTLALANIFLLHLSTGFAASSDEPVQSPTDWQVKIGLGLMEAPDFLGSSDYQLSAIPSIQAKYKDFFISALDGIGYNLVNNGEWRLGPVIRYDFGRKEDGNSPFRIAGTKTDALQGLGDVDSSVQLGGFVEYHDDAFTNKVEILQSIDGNQGLLAKLSSHYMQKLNAGLDTPVIFTVGPQATFASSKYNQAYFGINSQQSANSGLPEYNAGGGLLFYGVSATATLPVNAQLSATAITAYDRMSSQIAESPIIKQRGSANQWKAGLIFNYTFS